MKRVNPGVLSTGIVAVAALRILMAPYPNIEPIMLFTVVTALTLGPIAGFFMGFGSMVLSNIFMSNAILPWILHMPLVTVYTSLTYGLIGLVAGLLGIVKRNWRRLDLTALVAVTTVFYDLVTAICFAIQFYGFVGIPAALTAQIPFTMLHLSNALFAFLFAPYLLKAFTKTREISVQTVLKRLGVYT
ncbi:MAG: hypothetical protein U9Q22_05555 [Candidatus Altiarchaeota archaeon]|nr:hypothetical protein [Candidatus Altiarchaeota archaeon]